MASRVNVRFVVILSAVLAMVFVGVAGVFFVVHYRSADRYARLGEQKLSQGDINAADGFFARAVGKDRTNVAYLTKWRDVRSKKTPATESAFQDDYWQYVGILRTLAQIQRTNVEAHRAYLQEIYDVGRMDQLATEADASIEYFTSKAPGSVRRFRGIALTALYATGVLNPEKEADKKRINLAKEDLEAALQENPADAMAANDLVVWYRTMAAKTDDAAAASGLRESARKIVDGFVAARPADPAAAVLKLVQQAADIQERKAAPGQSSVEFARSQIAAMDGLKPAVAAVYDVFKTADPGALDATLVGRFATLAPRIDPKKGDEMATAILDRVQAVHPESSELIALRADLAAGRGDLEGAITQFQRIIDLPPRPVGIEGLRLFGMRPRAMFAQANAALALALQAKDEQARNAALERVKTYRLKLAQNVAENSPDLLFIDGKLKFIQDDFRAAQRLLTEFVRAPGGLTPQVAEAHLFLAEAAAKVGEAGRAREHLTQAQAAAPGSTMVLLRLAGIESGLRDYEAAAKHLAQVLELDPDNESAKKQAEILRAILSDDGKVTDDPVAAAMAQAERISRGKPGALGDEAAAIEYLEGSLEKNNYDARLIGAIIGAKAARGDREGALKTAQLGASKHPEDERLKDLVKRLEMPDTLETRLALIEQAGVSPLEKQLARREAYLSAGKKAEAAAALAEAAKIAPEDPRVLECNFVDAVLTNKLAEAAKIAEKAAALDADRAGGNTFKARLLLAQGQPREAEALLRKAADLGNANQAVYRLLGAVQASLGRGPDALNSYRRALELNPTDLQTIRALIGELARQDQLQEALAVARKSELYARRDAEFMNLWLGLEASAGSTQFALDRRQQMYKDKPEDADNGAALADLLITRKEWERARALLDELRKKADSARLAGLDARYFADRGDLEKARQVFVGYIEGINKRQEKMTPEPYVAFGQFMIQRGQLQNGLACLRQAARFQDPAAMAVDLLIGDTQLRYQMYADAEQSYRKVLGAGVADPDNRIRKRLIESLLQQQKTEELEKEFAALGPAVESDLELLVQRAEAARTAGDYRRAREILDSAVGKFPDEPLPYLRRARLVMGDKAMVKDATADLATAIRLRPGMWQALVGRARLLMAQGQMGDGLKDLRTAVDTNPGVDEIRLELIDTLLTQNLEADAVQIADAGAKIHGGDPVFATRLADRFAAKKFWTRAARLYKQVYDQVGTAPAAMPYLNALLSATPPALQEAEAVLSSPSLNVERSMDLLMARAQLRRKQQRAEDARADALAALALVTDAQSLARWTDRARRLYGEPARVVELLGAARPGAALQDWFTYFKGVAMMEDGGTREGGEKLLLGLRTPGQTSELQVAVAQHLSSVYDTQEKFDKALEIVKAGLQVAPDNATLNNNAAYFLNERLGRPAEALPYAERAVRAEPGNDRIIDTLAGTLWGLDRKPEAISRLTEALRAARTEADKATWAVKLAGWKLKAGDAKGAGAMADLVREMLGDNPGLIQSLSPKTKSDWEQLLTQLPANR